jgi:hypothetical protein
MIFNASIIALGLIGGMARPLGAHELKSKSLSVADLLDARQSVAVGSLNLRLISGETLCQWHLLMIPRQLAKPWPPQEA